MTPWDCSPPGSSVYGISQARILACIAISFSRGSSPPRDQTCISCTGRQILYHWATEEVPYAWYIMSTSTYIFSFSLPVPLFLIGASLINSCVTVSSSPCNLKIFVYCHKEWIIFMFVVIPAVFGLISTMRLTYNFLKVRDYPNVPSLHTTEGMTVYALTSEPPGKPVSSLGS